MCAERWDTLRPARGFTLIELVILIVVLAVGFTGIITVYVQSVRASADPLLQTQAQLLAESLLEEATAKPYLPGPGNTRDTWDDIDDYAGYDGTSPPTDATGAVIVGLEAFRAAFTVAGDALAGRAGKRIEVCVTHTADSGIKLCLAAWRFPD
jgi:MSHA pilin protein MshD